MHRLLTILVTIPLFMLAAFAREQPRKSRLMYDSVTHPDGLTGHVPGDGCGAVSCYGDRTCSLYYSTPG